MEISLITLCNKAIINSLEIHFLIIHDSCHVEILVEVA
jgi:hypothetical protein